MLVTRLRRDGDHTHAKTFLRERGLRWTAPREDRLRTYVMHSGGPGSEAVGLAQVRIGPSTFVLLTLEMRTHAERMRTEFLSRMLLHLLDEFRGRRALVANCGQSKAKRRMIKSCGRFQKIGNRVYEWELPAVPPPDTWGEAERADEISSVHGQFTAHDVETRRMFASGVVLLKSGTAHPVLTMRTFEFTRSGGAEIDGEQAEMWQEALRVPLKRDVSGMPWLESDPPQPFLEREGDFALVPPRRFLSIRLRVLGNWLNQRVRERGQLSPLLEARDIELQFTTGVEFAAAWRIFVLSSGWMEAGLVRSMEDLPSDVKWTSCPAYSMRVDRKPWGALGRTGTIWFGDYADARNAIYAYLFSAKGKVLAAIPDIQKAEMWEARAAEKGRSALMLRTQGREIEVVTDTQCVERVGKVFQ